MQKGISKIAKTDSATVLYSEKMTEQLLCMGDCGQRSKHSSYVVAESVILKSAPLTHLAATGTLLETGVIPDTG